MHIAQNHKLHVFFLYDSHVLKLLVLMEFFNVITEFGLDKATRKAEQK